MAIAELVRQYLETLLVWPVAVVVLALVLRKPLTRLLDGPVSDVIRRIKRFQAPGGLDAHIGDQVEEIQDALAEDKPEPEADQDQGQQLELTVTDQMPVAEAPPAPKARPRISANEVDQYVEGKLVSWTGYLQAMERYLYSQPRTTMVTVWEDGRRRIKRDINAATRLGVPGSSEWGRGEYPGTYSESWHDAYERADNVGTMLMSNGEVTTRTAQEFIASVDSIYRRHLNHLADALMAASAPEGPGQDG